MKTWRPGRRAPFFVGMASLALIAVFWLLILEYRGGVVEEETSQARTVAVVVNTTFWLERGEYYALEFQASQGDVINATVVVLEGNPVDFFLMEEAKKRVFEKWLAGEDNRFFTYTRGKGLNITSRRVSITCPVSGRWYLIVSNLGRMYGGAFPRGEVHLQALVVRVGRKVARSFG